MLAQRRAIVLIPGTSKLARLEENIATANLELTDADFAEIDAGAEGLEVAGKRYGPQHMSMVGREAPLVAAGA